jgi:FKBP-type peptidyl-prolyl cis-trans isomerase FkpA
MKFTWCLLLLAVLTGGCFKKDSGCSYSESNAVAPASEEQMVKDYLAAHSINATKHKSNMYYEIVSQGAGGSPGVCSQIVISYTGSLTSGQVFDQSTNAVFVLGSLIDGWKQGLPLIQKGGRIKLYIPPSLGYGGNDIMDDNHNVIIPKNSMLIFDITLTDFQ